MKTVRYKGYAIRQLRPDYYLADNSQKTNRRRRCFPTIQAARNWIEQEVIAVENLGISAYALTEQQRLDAVQALQIIGSTSTLTAAANFWARHHPQGASVTVEEIGLRWMDDLKRRNCRATTIRDRRQKVARFVGRFGDRPVVTVTTEDIRTWLDDQGGGHENYNSFRRVIGTMLAFAVDAGVMELNPVEKIKTIKTEAKMPTFWPVGTVEAMMRAAAEVAPELVPSLAIGFFAGLRPGEVQGLQWNEINLPERFIRVLPETSKVRAARLVTITDNLAQWLAAYRKESGPVAPAKITARRMRAKVLKSAKVAEWPQDVTRHTYATMHYAHFQDAAKLAAELGHTRGFDLIFKHYRGLATPKEAARFWAIVPHVESNIIHLVGAAS